jgi:hypothetical protein
LIVNYIDIIVKKKRNKQKPFDYGLSTFEDSKIKSIHYKIVVLFYKTGRLRGRVTDSFLKS